MMALPKAVALGIGAGVIALSGAIFAGTLRIKPGSRKRTKPRKKR